MYDPENFPPSHNQGVGAPPHSTGQKALLGQKTKEAAKNAARVLVIILSQYILPLYHSLINLRISSIIDIDIERREGIYIYIYIYVFG